MKSSRRKSQPFFALEAASGIGLLMITALALAWANSPFSAAYHNLWAYTVGGLSLHSWIEDGLMAVFFFTVGVEIKQELVHGTLSTKKQAAFPLAAALGGMCVPAAIYLAINSHHGSLAGWGIPMATDIAFALGALSLIPGVPGQLKVLLITLAVIDDLGAVAVIALFYTSHIAWFPLIGGLGLLALLGLLSRKLSAFWYLPASLLVWFAFLKSGIHPTIAGVLLALVAPLGLGLKLWARLHPWVCFGVIPLFALANAGVSLSGGSVFNPVCLGVFAGLALGKPIGIAFFTWLAVQAGIATPPAQTSWRQICSLACLGGIGFTMALFIASLAFGQSQQLESAKLGILLSSLFSATLGALLFTPTRKRP